MKTWAPPRSRRALSANSLRLGRRLAEWNRLLRPGAMFWMWTVAFLGASTAFVEATLAPIYKGKGHKRFAGFVVRFVTIACILILQKPALTTLDD